MPLTERQAVELFHLHVLRILATGPDKERVALKGGCNLRFFFGSGRYSEDMDLDAFGISSHILKSKVDRALEGSPLRLGLRSRGIEVTAFSSPKQTATTQRWKVELSVEGRSLPLHTKLEFSRRRAGGKARVEAVNRELLGEYQLMPLLAPHYARAEAIQQKIAALIGRSAVQARDVFDLAVLFSKGGELVPILKPVRTEIPKAIERVMEISYADFKSQVVAYLAPSALDEYGNPAAWDALQTSVVSSLQLGLR
jgi:predicted nucleotidyltransferase component of viral defense system